LRSVYNIPFNKKINYLFNPLGKLDEFEIEVIKVLLNAESISIGEEGLKGMPRVSSSLGDLYLPIEGLIDFDAERARLSKELSKIDKEIEKIQNKLSNPKFAERAPVEVLDEQRERLNEWNLKRVQLNEALDNLSS
jgi:valyl-tRNA synthetase